MLAVVVSCVVGAHSQLVAVYFLGLVAAPLIASWQPLATFANGSVGLFERRLRALFTSCSCFSSRTRFLGVSEVHGDEFWRWDVDGGDGVLVIVRADITRSELNRFRPVARNPLAIFCGVNIAVLAWWYMPKKSDLSTWNIPW
jgi:hypothetical protein